MRTERAGVGSQRGTASVEFMLIVPFMLILTVLAFLNTRLMFLNQHNTAAARTHAWERARYNNPLCVRPQTRDFGGSYGEVSALSCFGPGNRNRSAADDFRDRYAGNSDQQRFVAIVRDEGVPTAYTTTARAQYNPAPVANFFMNGRLTADFTRSYTVDADPERWSFVPTQNLTVGYDNYLDDQLSSYLFDDPQFFPNASR